MSPPETTKSPIAILTPDRRRALRADAHHLNPVVSISQKGLTASVLAEIDRSLKVHELIKVRLYGIDREVRTALFTEICTELACQEVQHIGNLLVLWRKKPAAPKAAEHQLVPATRGGREAGGAPERVRRQRSQPVTKGTAKPRNAPTKRQAMAAEGRNAAGRPLRNSLTKKNTDR